MSRPATPDSSAQPAGDEVWMAEAVALGESVRCSTSPNPWVGAVVVPSSDAPVALGATSPPGGPHAEVVALELAGPAAGGSTLFVTLEPCSHFGRTPPCADAIIAAGVRRVVVGVEDPDPRVRGAGIARLREAGVEVTVGVGEEDALRSLAPYLHHRRTGRPWVVLKLAATLDGRIAAPDGGSKWITGPLARADAHRLRAESDAVLVGAGTVRADDPQLTVRDADSLEAAGGRQPVRVVLGEIPPGARVSPAESWTGDLPGLVEELGRRDVLQLLVEGGARTAHAFHSAGLVDQYVFYFAAALMGGDDGLSLFSGPGAPSMNEISRGRITSVRQMGPDVRIDFVVAKAGDAVA